MGWPEEMVIYALAKQPRSLGCSKSGVHPSTVPSPNGRVSVSSRIATMKMCGDIRPTNGDLRWQKQKNRRNIRRSDIIWTKPVLSSPCRRWLSGIIDLKRVLMGINIKQRQYCGIEPGCEYTSNHPISLAHKLPSGKLTVCYGKSPFLMGKSTISMAIFNCYVSSPEGISKK